MVLRNESGPPEAQTTRGPSLPPRHWRGETYREYQDTKPPRYHQPSGRRSDIEAVRGGIRIIIGARGRRIYWTKVQRTLRTKTAPVHGPATTEEGLALSPGRSEDEKIITRKQGI